ncbi:DUF4411 family protein [Pseudomonas cichorii]|nr:DUF4411 family protein [Pseudomonas cichorii]MBX8534566.1 DUF4411 family protein [Pseudomonas cichorii]
MLAFDASSMIYAWDNYPETQFPGLWKWIKGQISSGLVAMPLVAFEETSAKSPDCGKWLKDSSLGILHPSTEILRRAASLKDLLGIEGNRYGIGVGENDLIIIATAEMNGVSLVSNEAVQKSLPAALSKYKIPAVCALKKPPTEVIDFLVFIKRSGAKF